MFSTRTARWTATAAAAVVLTSLAACSSSSGKDASDGGGNLKLASPLEQTEGFTPVQFGRGNTVFANQLYDPLVNIGSDGKPTPKLATSWEWGEGRHTLTMHLVKGATFHDGKPVNADAVKFTWDYVQDPANAANLRSLIGQFITDVDVVDDSTFRFDVKVPSDGIFDLLSLFFVLNPDKASSMVSQDAGSGPFKLGSYVPGNHYTMLRNPNYWEKGQPKLSSITVNFITDGNAQLAALQTHQVDLVFLLDFNSIEQASKDPKLKLFMGPYGSQNPYLTMNVTRKPFTDVRVRQAIAMAIDRKSIVDTVLLGSQFAQVACQPFAKTSPFYDPSLQPATCTLDPAKAKSLLAEAGYPNGLSTSVNVSANYGPPRAPEMAQELQQDLKKIGVDLKINVLEGAQARKQFIAGDFDMELHSFQGSDADPALIHPSTTWGSVPGAFNQFNDPRLLKLELDAAQAEDLATRKKLYSEFTQKALDAAYLDMIAYQRQVSAGQTNLDGVTWGTNGFPILEKAELGSSR